MVPPVALPTVTCHTLPVLVGVAETAMFEEKRAATVLSKAKERKNMFVERRKETRQLDFRIGEGDSSFYS
jgi:hypothetical protein